MGPGLSEVGGDFLKEGIPPSPLMQVRAANPLNLRLIGDVPKPGESISYLVLGSQEIFHDEVKVAESLSPPLKFGGLSSGCWLKKLPEGLMICPECEPSPQEILFPMLHAQKACQRLLLVGGVVPLRC